MTDRAAYLSEHHKKWRARMSPEQRRKRLESAARYRKAHPDRVHESYLKQKIRGAFTSRVSESSDT